MGTNYFWIKQKCEMCGHKEAVHIGKNSYGWTFHFHGTAEIRSCADWLVKLESGGFIQNEYDETISLKDFKELVEDKKDSKLNHTTECKEYYSSSTHQTWLDNDGNSFSSGEFL